MYSSLHCRYGSNFIASSKISSTLPSITRSWWRAHFDSVRYLALILNLFVSKHLVTSDCPLWHGHTWCHMAVNTGCPDILSFRVFRGGIKRCRTRISWNDESLRRFIISFMRCGLLPHPIDSANWDCLIRFGDAVDADPAVAVVVAVASCSRRRHLRELPSGWCCRARPAKVLLARRNSILLSWHIAFLHE